MDQDTNTATNPAINTAPDRGFSHTSYVMGGIIIVLMLIVGGWYYMNQGMMGMGASHEEMGMETVAPLPGTQEEIAASEEATVAATAALTTQSTSDELDSIDADLKSTDLDSLGDPSQL